VGSPVFALEAGAWNFGHGHRDKNPRRDHGGSALGFFEAGRGSPQTPARASDHNGGDEGIR
jgi:hypothetical protein